MAPDSAANDAAREIEARIIGFIENELLGSDTTVDRNDDLLSGDLLDSIGVLRLSVYVEEEFQLKIQPADYVIENFQNAAVIADFVRRTGLKAKQPTTESG